MTDRTANPRTPVQFRARPPHFLPEIIGEKRERCASQVAHDANEKRTVTGTYAGTAVPRHDLPAATGPTPCKAIHPGGGAAFFPKVSPQAPALKETTP